MAALAVVLLKQQRPVATAVDAVLLLV